MTEDAKSWLAQHGPWLQMASVLLMNAATIGYFTRGLTDGQERLSADMIQLKGEVHEMRTDVKGLTEASARDAEHLRNLDRRVDHLEVGKWERPTP